MSDMEQARLVRWALSLAIDRDYVVEEVQAGLGAPLYTEYIGPLYPGWDPGRKVVKSDVDAILEKHGCAECPTYDVGSPAPDREWPWRIPLDRVTSEELLDMAGYPRGDDGTRFNIKIVKNPCETGDLCLDQANAVADAWEEIGDRRNAAEGANVSHSERSHDDAGAVLAVGNQLHRGEREHSAGLAVSAARHEPDPAGLGLRIRVGVPGEDAAEDNL